MNRKTSKYFKVGSGSDIRRRMRRICTYSFELDQQQKCCFHVNWLIQIFLKFWPFHSSGNGFCYCVKISICAAFLVHAVYAKFYSIFNIDFP
jgi:hypothetical protein